jgi:hypothetical protein
MFLPSDWISARHQHRVIEAQAHHPMWAMSHGVGGPLMLKQVDHSRAGQSVEGEPHGRLTRREWGAASRKEGRWTWPRPNSDRLGAAVPSSYYEIRVTSVLPPEVLLDFDRLIASVEPVETVLHGPLRDQADLNGLLARLETFGVQVLEIRRRRDRDPPAADREPRG